MAKMIRMSPECIAQVKQEFEAMLLSGKFADGKVSYNKSFSSFKRPCTVYYSEIAWLKMQSLISECEKEVGWHGIAYRGDDPDKDEYIITDILVYPQEVTGATVTTDQTKYQTWLMSHDDDVFNNIRMQGHSHVNMSVTPSATDTTLYESFLSQLDNTMFYIFLIYNKKGECTYKIYDLAKNVMFDTSDVTVEVTDDGLGIEEFLRTSKEMVKERVVAPATSSQYNKWPGSGYYATPSYQKPASTAQTQAPKKDEPKKEQEKIEDDSAKKKKEKMFKRASKEKNMTAYYGSYRNIDGYYDDFYDDYESPYGPFGYYDGFYR